MTPEQVKCAEHLLREGDRIRSKRWNRLADYEHGTGGEYVDRMTIPDARLLQAIAEFRARQLDYIVRELRALGVSPPEET